MFTEMVGAATGFKAIIDAIAAIKDMNDATARNIAVGDLYEKVARIQQAYAAVVEEASELKARVNSMNDWATEKARYQLQSLPPGVNVYRIIEAVRGEEPIHYICAYCYTNNKKSYLQAVAHGHGLTTFSCIPCGFQAQTGHYSPPAPERPSSDPFGNM
mgnify:FL=1